MSKQRAYGAPQEDKAVVITMDRRLALAGGMIVVFAVALGAGALKARRSAPGAEAQGGATTQRSGAELAAEIREVGMDPSKAVVITPIAHLAPGDDSPFSGVQVTPAVPAVQPAVPLPVAPEVAPSAGELALPTQGANPLDSTGVDITKALPPVEARYGDKWDPDVIAGMPDPNLSEDTQPLRLELVSGPLKGPRVAISQLNEQFTYNFGVVPKDRVAEHDFDLVNVGDTDLIVSRIYASCGCTATLFGDTLIKPDGFLPEPVTLKPGESKPFGIQFDPRTEGTTIAQAKYIQIYTNDPTRFLFDDDEPLSHEIRFRITVKPE